jgi:hypothetical protein
MVTTVGRMSVRNADRLAQLGRQAAGAIGSAPALGGLPQSWTYPFTGAAVLASALARSGCMFFSPTIAARPPPRR